MARHSSRACVVTYSGRMYSIPEREAYQMLQSGQADKLTSNRDLRHGKQLKIRLIEQRKTIVVVATLTEGDMISNAESRADRHRSPARAKVDAWPTVHDTFAVTISAGKIIQPDPKEALKRAKEMRSCRSR